MIARSNKLKNGYCPEHLITNDAVNQLLRTFIVTNKMWNTRSHMKWMNVMLILLFISATGCYYDKAELLYPGVTFNCSNITARYSDVQPIIALNCATTGCHDSGTRAGNTVLETYDQVRVKADRIFIRTIVERSMPAGKTLSSQEIAILNCWLNSGTPNN